MYNKFDFCKAVNCAKFKPKNRIHDDFCRVPSPAFCEYTAKEFHQWLTEQGYLIYKESDGFKDRK